MQPAPPATCPLCDAPLTAESHRFRPFCSKRCKLLDLSRWLSEEYRVPGEPAGDGGAQPRDEEEVL
jgi:endogenous inhibitor of DNA gyrase (YacG/DUF329 family)